MTSEIITAIGLILAALLGGGFWQYRQSRKEAPVKKKDADLAAAKAAQQMALDVADDLREDVSRFRDQLNTLSGRVDSLETHIREQDKTIRRLRDAVRLFDAAWDDLTSRWAYYRQSEHPPPRPNVNVD